MKKKYINPELTVINVQIQPMMAQSQTVDFGEGTKKGSDAASRDAFGLWEPDDEFDEEEFE
jgi:hypothetical protein